MISDFVDYDSLKTICLGVADNNHVIENVEDLSDETMNRMLIIFKNGISLSVIQGEFSYGGADKLFEIAFSKNGEITNSILGGLQGYLTARDVVRFINETGELDG